MSCVCGSCLPLTDGTMRRRSATLRQEEATGQIMGLLLGLDAVRFLLLVDPPQDSPRAAGRLIGGLRQYLPQPWAGHDHAHDGASSSQQPRQANPAPVSTLLSADCFLSKRCSAISVSGPSSSTNYLAVLYREMLCFEGLFTGIDISGVAEYMEKHACYVERVYNAVSKGQMATGLLSLPGCCRHAGGAEPRPFRTRERSHGRRLRAPRGRSLWGTPRSSCPP